VAALIYFTGCLTFAIGLAAELTCPEEIAAPVMNYAFLLGSLQFALGGLAECIENEVFTSLAITTAWVGALLNFTAGLSFLLASVLTFISTLPSFWSSLLYGIGSAMFVLGGSLQLVLWRDEQFGLTYMAVMNKLGGHTGRPIVSTGPDDKAHEQDGFSLVGLFFIHFFSLTAAVSCYDFNMAVADFVFNPGLGNLHRAIADLAPAIVLHMEIALQSAVVRTPRSAPYRQIFVLMRIVATVLAFDSVIAFIHLVQHPLSDTVVSTLH